MNQGHQDDSWTRIMSACTGPIRVLEVQHLGSDTYAIFENGGVSLSDGASLTLLLKQLEGRESQ